MRRSRARINLARRVDVNMGVPRHYPKNARRVVMDLAEAKRRLLASLRAEGRLAGYGMIDADEPSF